MQVCQAFHIVSAVYGGQDFKSVVEGIYAGGNNVIGATNDNFGDPAPGVVKSLIIAYRCFEDRTESANENGIINIPNESVIYYGRYGG